MDRALAADSHYRVTGEVPIAAHANNIGFTEPANLAGGAFNIWGNTFPADELPLAPLTIGGVPFLFPPAQIGRPDNIRCAAQLLTVEVGRYHWAHILCAAERRTEDRILLHYGDGVIEHEWLRVSDFWPQTEPRFGETPALRFTKMHYPRHIDHRMAPVIWLQRLPLPRDGDLVALQLPDNPAMHLFAITLVRDTCPHETV